MIDNYKYVVLDGTSYYKYFYESIAHVKNYISPNIASVIYFQIMRLFFDRINIGVAQLQFPPNCDDIIMAYGMIIPGNIKGQLCEIIHNYYFSITPGLLNELSKQNLLSNGILQNHMFIEHEAPSTLIVLMRIL